MICYKDRSFCVSPMCKNECGRKLTKEILEEAKEYGLPVSCMYFCGEASSFEEQEWLDEQAKRTDGVEETWM